MVWVIIGVLSVLLLITMGVLSIAMPAALAGLVSWLFRVEGDITAFKTHVLTALGNAQKRNLPLLSNFLKALVVDDWDDAFMDVWSAVKMIMDPVALDKELELIVETQLPILMKDAVIRQKILTIVNAAVAAASSAAAAPVSHVTGVSSVSEPAALVAAATPAPVVVNVHPPTASTTATAAV